MKLKDEYPFEGKPGEDFDGRWVIVKICSHNQPERFEDIEGTIYSIGWLL